MAVVISLLRGVNVGGHNQIKMDALRALCASLQLRDACTYVQSGNVVFRTSERDLALVARRMQNGIERRFGFRPEVILRTVSELRDVIARNPFAARRGIEPNKFLVIFLACDPGAEARQQVLHIQSDPEELRMDGREVYAYYPNGIARPKIPWGTIERVLKVAGTARNWNSVTRLLELAQQLEESQ